MFHVVVDCGPPPLPATLSAGLSISLPSNATTFGNTALYNCDVGYNRVAGVDFNRTCLPSGNWSGATPQCRSMLVLVFLRMNYISVSPPSVVDCVFPEFDPGPGGLTVEISTRTPVFNSTATYSCQTTGYEISGSATRTCQADGSYSGMEPTCTRESISCSEIIEYFFNCIHVAY